METPPDIPLCAIVAMARNRVIGRNNALIWHIPEDLRHFKATTMGKPIIMGRKSYEALGKPLPGRPHIVISRTGGGEPDCPSVRFVRSIDEAIALGRKIAQKSGTNEVFITGGGEIYRQTLPLTQRLYLTVLDRDYEGDTYFPEIDWNAWDMTSKKTHPPEPEKNRPACTFYVLERKS